MGVALFELDGKVAVVTGAGSGLGRRFCLTLAEAGAQVVALGRRRTELEQTADLVRAAGGTCEAMVADVTDVAGLGTAMTTAAGRLGRIDILVNNAGVGGRAALVDVDESYFDRVFDTNIKGLFFTAQAAARQMI